MTTDIPMSHKVHACRSVAVVDFNPYIVDQSPLALIIRGESQESSSSDSLSYLLLDLTAVRGQIFAVGP